MYFFKKRSRRFQFYVLFLVLIINSLNFSAATNQPPVPQKNDKQTNESTDKPQPDESTSKETDKPQPDESTSKETDNLQSDESTSKNADKPKSGEQIDQSTNDDVSPLISGQKYLPPHDKKRLDQTLASHYMPIDILINGLYLKTDVDAFSFKNRTYVPLRSITETFGADSIQWDSQRMMVTITFPLTAFADVPPNLPAPLVTPAPTQVNSSEEINEPLVAYDPTKITFEFLMNKPVVFINGHQYDLSTPIINVNGRTLLPLRFITEKLGFTVTWNKTYYTVSLSHPTLAIASDKLEQRFYTYDELQIFAKLVTREAGGTSYETQHGVASVIMNHYRHPSFPNTINGVIYAKSKSPHFTPAHRSNFLSTLPRYLPVLVAKQTLRGENSVANCLYFNTRPFKGKKIYKKVDGVYFCY